MNTRSPTIFTLIILAVVCVCPFAVADKKPENLQLELVECRVEFPSCAISDAQLKDWMQSKDLAVIDSRPIKKYHSVRISGSINASLFSIKTKDYLKNKKILLIGEDYTVGALNKACLEIKENGFANVKFLRGGVRYWHQAGGKVSGNANLLKRISEMPAYALAEEMGSNNWQILTIGCNDFFFSAMDWPGVGQVSYPTNKEKFQMSLRKKGISSVKIPAPSSLAFISCEEEPERIYKEIAPLVSAVRQDYVYYVSGGGKAVDRFKAQYDAIRNGKLEREKSRGQCGG